MLIPPLPGWAAGERVTAAKLTQHTKTAIEAGVYYKPFCEIQANAAQSLSGTFNKLVMPTIVEDNDTMSDPANSRIVIKTPGRYRILGQCALGVGLCDVALLISINESGYKAANAGSTPTASDILRLQVSRSVRLNTNDTVTLWLWSNVAISTENPATYGGSWLSAEWAGL